MLTGGCCQAVVGGRRLSGAGASWGGSIDSERVLQRSRLLPLQAAGCKALCGCCAASGRGRAAWLVAVVELQRQLLDCPTVQPAHVCVRLLACLPAVRDSRRAHLPGGSIKLERGQYDVKAKDEALEVRSVEPLAGASWVKHCCGWEGACCRGAAAAAPINAIRSCLPCLCYSSQPAPTLTLHAPLPAGDGGGAHAGQDTPVGQDALHSGPRQQRLHALVCCGWSRGPDARWPASQPASQRRRVWRLLAAPPLMGGAVCRHSRRCTVCPLFHSSPGCFFASTAPFATTLIRVHSMGRCPAAKAYHTPPAGGWHGVCGGVTAAARQRSADTRARAMRHATAVIATFARRSGTVACTWSPPATAQQSRQRHWSLATRGPQRHAL